MDTMKAVLLQQWISDKKRQREHREAQDSARQAAAETNQHNENVRRLKEQENQELRNYHARALQEQADANLQADAERQRQKQEQEAIKELKQRVFDLRDLFKRACETSDAIERHDRLFSVRREAIAVDMSMLTDIADKSWHAETLDLVDKRFLEVRAEVDPDRGKLLEQLFSACENMKVLCSEAVQMVDDGAELGVKLAEIRSLIEEREKRRAEVMEALDGLHRATTPEKLKKIKSVHKLSMYEKLLGQNYANKEELSQAIDAGLEAEVQGNRAREEVLRQAEGKNGELADLVGKCENLRSDLGICIEFLPEIFQLAVEYVRNWRTMVFGFQSYVAVAGIDGEVTPAELDFLRNQAPTHFVSAQRTHDLVQEMSPLDMQHFSGDADQAKALVDTLCEVAALDGRIDSNEIELIHEIGCGIGLPKDVLEAVFRESKARYFDPIFEFQCLVFLAKCDGQIDPDEIELLRECASACGIDPESCDRVIGETSSLNVKAFSGDKEKARSIVQSLFRVSLADGEVSPAEAKWIGKIGVAIGLSKDTIKEIITETRESIAKERSSQVQSPLDIGNW